MSIEETGIGMNSLLRILMKAMYVHGAELEPELADVMKIGRNIVKDLLDEARTQMLVETKGSAGASIQAEIRYGLTGKGQAWAADALELSQYIGPVPVSLASYYEQIRKQPLIGERVEKDAIDRGLAEYVVPRSLVRRLGQAVNSARAMLLYGAPGNGKTTIGEIIGGVFKEIIFIPYCIEVDGNIIKIYDPAIHVRETDASALLRAVPEIAGYKSREIDGRWVACRRPTVIAGGELTLEMLDLQFNEYSKFYEAPLHVKAMGGTFLIDDLGRQLVEPEALLNRWITPLEKRVDYLTLSSGRTFTLPFDVLVIFATNLTPEDLMDPAFLRRIAYKVQIHQPTEEHYRQVFRMLCEKHKVPYDDSVANFAMDKIQNVLNQPLAFYQPRFIVEQIIAACKYEGVPPRMNVDLLIDALDNISLEEGLIAPESTAPLRAN
ncbi:MAG TPA: ATP-binding protein [Alphaproteobacteria bacterium]